MFHLTKLPIMKERVAIQQAQFLFRLLSLPENTLLYHLMPHIQHTRGHQWYRLSKIALWRLMPPTITDLDTRDFRAIKKNFLHSDLEKQIQGKNSRLLSSCRPTITWPYFVATNDSWRKKSMYTMASWLVARWSSQTLPLPSQRQSIKTTRHQLPQYASPSLYAWNNSWPYILPFEYASDTHICSF